MPWQPGAQGWLANFLIMLTQLGDGAGRGAALTGANELSIKLASGASVFWDMQILQVPRPQASGQTFTLTAELLN